ncbi:indole-3-glycerol phosphate synthase TrpC [Metabacillus iocasae]|uniref:Indole-3-glycerol phosphate synthase n=1 Tax=Priestia iocasae TaxID=2291674 RepID=A0ABS2QQJ6_9BACI|nr:indole-3-glycerol phosphate synthase TrpC [Metabacillus iocasae]MBM7701728.1 indole-3-glycerol phosphate synthase [Metabacillus iocasae]
MLKQILQTKQEEISQLVVPEQQITEHYSLYEALSKPNRTLGLIAEVKRASPSKGMIKENFNHLEIAQSYEQGGADALSVLTDEQYFKGHRNFLIDIKKQIQLPVLRKDFIIDPIQVTESARIGADAILLIGEAMEPSKLYELYKQAYEEGLECLVEVHAKETLESILNVFTPAIIGVNNRDLHTFTTSIEQTKEIAQFVPKDSLLVSESGIGSYEDIHYVKQSGAHGVLVGESLMRQDSQKAAIQKLFGESAHAR